MEGIDLVDVIEIGRGGFVGEIDRVIQREIPHRERLEFCITGPDSAPMLVIEL